MTPDGIPICQHVKVNGVRCGSPAMRRRPYCFFHDQTIGRVPRRRRRSKAKGPDVAIPLLEDANAVQLGIDEVITAFCDGNVDNRQASVLLYALQTASANLRQVNFRPYWRDVVTDIEEEGKARPLRSKPPQPEIELPSGDRTIEVLRKILPMGAEVET